MAEAKWYAVHTYSGYENKVKTTIEETVRNRHLQDQIIKTEVPIIQVMEMNKDGALKQVKKKKFPGYAFIKMVMNDDTWYIVRNTRGVTGFVGPGSKPVPLTDEEAKSVIAEEGTKIETDLEVGDFVTVIAGPWENKSGIVQKINPSKGTVTISIEFLGVEMPYADVRKAN